MTPGSSEGTRPVGPSLGSAVHGEARSDPLGADVDAARRGDAAACERIAAGLSPPLLKTVRALSGPQHPDAEDLVQEVLLAVFDALPGFRGDCTLLHFAVRIAIRRTTAAKRRSLWIVDRLREIHLRDAPLATSPATPRDSAIAQRRRELLRVLLSEIPDTQAETIVLRLALGYSIEEISTMTRAPANTVRSRLRLAKEALRRRVEASPEWAELWNGAP